MQDGNITLESETVTNFYDTGGADGKYANDEDFTLTVKAPAGKSVQVNFSNFDTEYEFDPLYIYNGTSTDASLLATLDGEFSETKTYAATNADGALTFRFNSDADINADGWEATLTTIDAPTAYTLSFSNDKGLDNPTATTVYGGIAIGALPELAVVNGHLFLGWEIDGTAITAETIYDYSENKTATAVWAQDVLMQNGNITLESETVTKFYDTGGADGKFANDEDLTLTVKAPAGKLVQVNFTKFDVYSSGYDYIEIYNGSSTSAPLLVKHDEDFYDTKTYTAANADGVLTFKFYSSYSNTAGGWEAALTTVDAPTEYYTLSFSNDKGLDNPAEKTVYADFLIGELPELADVEDNIFLGWEIDDVRITAETEYSYGFNKTATAVYEQGYRMRDGEISLEADQSYTFYDSGDKYGNFANNEDLVFTVKAPEGRSVQVSFADFAVYDSYDYIEIYDGSNTDAPLLVKHVVSLGYTHTYIATNADGALTFKFHSSHSVTATGWEATLSLVADVPTAIEQVQAAPFTRLHNTLYFAASTAVSVYNVSGVMLYNGTAVTEYELPSARGVYIIHTSAGAHKVMAQ